MNKMISLFVCMTLILIAVAVWGSLQRNDPPAVSWAHMDKHAYSTANSVSSQESSSEITVMADGQPSYLVQEYRGHLGIFRHGSQFPFQELEIEVESMPRASEQLLRHGIIAADDAALRHILDDDGV